MVILSVDLAARRYRDFGIAVLSGSSSAATAQFVSPVALGLTGLPDPVVFAERLAAHGRAINASLILLDGPQAWKAPNSTDLHMRRCERATRTPGKTGLPGKVKPGSWTRMVTFSVTVFDALDRLGWPRFNTNWTGERSAIESFPTHAWRTVRLAPLPGKSKKGVRPAEWCSRLCNTTGLTTIGEPSHDEIQAAIAGLAGLLLLEGRLDRCDVAGDAPFLAEGYWREGFIISPKWPAA